MSRALFHILALGAEYSARPMQRERGRAGARVFIALAALLACLAATVGSARAGEADDLVKQGLELRRKGRDAQALELFKRAHELSPGARTAAQLGFAEQALGMWTDAEAHLAAALKHDEDPWIKKNRAVIRKAADFVVSHLGTLEVWGKPDGAEVLIGGTVAGVLPLAAPLRVSAGTVSITVRAAGHVELARVIEVAGGAIVRERFELPRTKTQTQTPAPRPVLSPTSTSGNVASAQGSDQRPLVQLRAQPTTEPAPAESRSIFSRWWFWTIVGGVAIAGGATAYLLTHPRSTCPGGTCSGVSP